MTEPSNTAGNLLPPGIRRHATLLAALAVAVALVGFLSGIAEPGAPHRPPAHHAKPPGKAPAAVTYSELPAATLQPNSNWTVDLTQLKFERPGLFDPVTRTDDMKLAAVNDRSHNRGYDGAPPTIPHPVEARSAKACLACHGEGIKVGDRVASRMSHTLMTNCTQCHVEQSPVAGPANNMFRGVNRAGPGPRANPGAPPGVPHSTFMREQCLSCHGLITRPGTRTTHPWLSNCLQCHAPSAVLDQAPVGGLHP